jgi:cyclopropane fatty-acyl-phospholipid synthase-like methyltransferase
MAMGFDGDFVRKWVYYLALCEASFATRALGTLHVVAERRP